MRFTEGPTSAKILILGGYPTRQEMLGNTPYRGASGVELGKMLHEAGIPRTECRLMYIMDETAPRKTEDKHFFSKHTKATQIPKPELIRAKEAVLKEIEQHQYEMVICLGDLAWWVMTGNWSVSKWRSTILHDERFNCNVSCTYTPSQIMRMWSWRFLLVHDIRRAISYHDRNGRNFVIPDYNFQTRPTYSQVMEQLTEFEQWADHRPLKLATDTETFAGQIAVIGFAWSKTHAISIPFRSVDDPAGYFTYEEEVAIVLKIIRLFKHPNILWVLQNAAYDYQYFARNWGTVPTNLHMDTMLSHHVCWSGLPKGLDFLSSLYCEYHRYWKDDGKEYHKGIATREEEDEYWIYNAQDCVTTYECSEVLEESIESLGLSGPNQFQHTQFWPVLMMMLRGVRMNTAIKSQYFMDLTAAIADREQAIHDMVDFELNPRSPKQMKEFFYDELKLPTIRNRKTGSPTLDAKALTELAGKEPLIRPLVSLVGDFRSAGVFLSTFVNAPLDHDKRMRCSYNLAGTETYRYSSSSDAFGYGTNLQNIPKGNVDD